jgi:hypothetical protein
MSFEYSVHPADNLIRVRWCGEFTMEELIKRMEEMAGDPLVKPGMNMLGDYREARWIGDVQEIGDYIDYNEKVEAERGEFKSAVMVACEDELEVVRIFDLVAHQRGLGIDTRGFLDESDAMGWLAIEG